VVVDDGNTDVVVLIIDVVIIAVELIKGVTRSVLFAKSNTIEVKEDVVVAWKASLIVLGGIEVVVLRGIEVVVLRGIEVVVLRGIEVVVLRGVEVVVLGVRTDTYKILFSTKVVYSMFGSI
jgi:hypothetical protein